ncbi:MAG: hypothetical protein GX589_06305 [Deltaproteobacteria bacterium]|nr:hypothetical protein [Deltaproteobacteria bacterium]
MHRVLLCTLCLFLATAAALPTDCSAQASKSKREKRFPGYGKYRKLFKQLCEGIKQDGHQVFLYTLLTQDSTKALTCTACPSFFRAFASACKPPKPKKKKEKKKIEEEKKEEEEKELTQEEQLKPIEQPQPSVSTTESALTLSSSIVRNQAAANPSFEVTKLLSKLPQDPSALTNAQQSYLEGLSQTLSTPFRINQGFNDYQRKFIKICMELDEDRMQTTFYKSLPPHKDAPLECLGCWPLLMNLSSACEPDSEEESFNTSEIKAPSEISGNVRDRVETTFSEIANNVELVDAGVPAVNLLSGALKSAAIKDPAASRYLGELAGIISAPFEIYGIVENFAPKMEELCQALALDGRRQALSNILTASLPQTQGCPACRALIKELADACHPDKASSPTTTPTKQPSPSRPPVKEREPHLEVINAASNAFQSLAKNIDWRLACLPGVEFLLKILNDPEGKTKAELEYFKILAGYIEAPFSAELTAKARKAAKEAQAQSDEPDRKRLDELFNF